VILSPTKSITALALLAVLYCPYAAAQAKPARPHRSAKSKPAPTKHSETVTLVGAGDIASCKDPEGARATAALIDKIPGTVFAAGDLAYEKGSSADFQNCYGPSWGRFKDRTRPALGNHEYALPGPATAYFQYWGAQAGPVGKGYYSLNLGAWHIIALNTNCTAEGVGGCASGSPEETWLKEDLAAHPNVCILAYGHHALFSSGIFKSHAVHPELKALWQDLYAAHADLILAGTSIPTSVSPRRTPTATPIRKTASAKSLLAPAAAATTSSAFRFQQRAPRLVHLRRPQADSRPRQLHLGIHSRRRRQLPRLRFRHLPQRPAFPLELLCAGAAVGCGVNQLRIEGAGISNNCALALLAATIVAASCAFASSANGMLFAIASSAASPAFAAALKSCEIGVTSFTSDEFMARDCSAASLSRHFVN